MNDEEKKALENLGGAIGRRDCTDLYWKDADIIYDLIQKQESEINKLNNVIDRMAKYIYSKTDFTTCGNIKFIKEYFMKEVE